MSTELIATRALTNVARMKARLTIESASFDTILERMIMGVTDQLESICNRKFARATYTNEVYSIHNPNTEMIAINNIPVVSISSAQYRAGTPATPSWTSYTTDEYEIVNDGKSGLVRVYGGVRRGINSIRFTYIAGYLIDFDPADVIDTTKHTLPYDLTDLAERLVTKRFKRREHEGKLNESFDGGTVTWEDFITKEDREIINRYSRLPSFV